MISILTPTRGRPEEYLRMVESAVQTAADNLAIEFISYHDDDDPTWDDYINPRGYHRVTMFRGPRIVLTDCWNKCLPFATGDILMQANDDIIFRTPGWDKMVEGAFAQSLDKFLMVYGDDLGMHHGCFGPHPFVHRRWLDITGGWMIPPYFWSECGDTWLNDVFQGVDRRVYIPFVVEHMHWEFKKAELDQTYRDRLKNHQTTNPYHEYEFRAPERIAQVEKMRALLGTRWKKLKAGTEPAQPSIP